MHRAVKLAIAALALFAASSSLPGVSTAKDIKDLVIKETILDEQIKAFCALRCVGNEKEGTLKSLNIDPMGSVLYTVIGVAALRNRQVMKEPFEYVLFDHTVYVSSRGTLDPRTCLLKVDDAKVDNDYNGIFTDMLRSEADVIGKSFKIPDCLRFIPPKTDLSSN
ncbi:MAG: hypothetical protein F9K51_08635 [Candidatus Dadabacteria bacterium]|nr:MAG: hypothetical protein F9K51_08635 [Candidatus Dadabacteria bacterium]